MIEVRLQAERFDPGAELARLEALGSGAVASFIGIVRGEGGLASLRLDHYPGMAERAMQAIADEAASRWPLLGLVLVHRHGTLAANERIVFVGTASRHRAAALEACAFLIDWAKAKAPFWKQETFHDGTTRWVEARAIDDAAAARW
ncbi:molybdenum cofactor biosynthesis protein MoaE [Sphingomonas solaris]|uniref:Molybdopterin synthase catalytic subunit n=1 Tax=Alterirhizorhabdus solaris TaxID=2529389 RepID=A0A558R267_9SPHN|nr:molybdenum cofactor biosynthesis protein MoaE [Sphingomonas solaris]TVV73470.1 molybdenum cofactor biosynthesis protein MoaE [Sphingomonas solaris]